jgi:hypothetical protein
LDLLSHPTFKNHELVWEFLIVPTIEQNLIASRTKSKREHILDTVFDTFTPVIESVSKSVQHFKDSQARLVKLQNAIKQTGASVKRLGQSKKEFSMAIRIMRYNLGRYLEQF